MFGHLRLGLLALALLVGGCVAEHQGHPLASARAEPQVICLGDGHTTIISLSADGSQPKAHLPGTAIGDEHCLSGINWSVAGSEYQVVSGSEYCRPRCPCLPDEGCDAAAEIAACRLEISLPGDHGALVILTVANQHGEIDEAEVAILLDVPAGCDQASDCCPTDLADCPLDCVDGRCAPPGDCADDADCGGCYRCTAAGRCAHRGLSEGGG